MGELRNKPTDYLLYLAVRVVAMFVQMFNWRLAYHLGGRMGDVWYRLDGRHRRRATGHVRQSFPDWAERKVRRIVRGSFRNLIYLGIEALLTTRLITHWRWRRHLVLTEMSEVFRWLHHKNGIIFVTGHFGGWEVAGYATAALGFEGFAVARPLDNPYLNEFLMGAREKMGMRIIDKRGASGRMGEILRAGRYLSFIADQDAGPRGIFVDFFGRQASTYKAPALMAMEYDLPIAVCYGRRIDEQYRFEIGIQRIIYPREWAEKNDPMKWITQEYTAALEAVIRSAPEQYLWIYRRWKTRPSDERPGTNTPPTAAVGSG